MTFRPSLTLALFFSMIAGCSGADKEDDGCDCIDIELNRSAKYICESEGGCGEVVANCDVHNSVESTACGLGQFTVDEAALDCAIDRLIAGEPGLISFKVDSNGSVRSGGFVEVGADRKGLAYAWVHEDLNFTESNTGTVPLKDAAYFEGCKSKPDLDSKFMCFKAWGVGEPSPVCEMGGQEYDGL